MSLRLDAESIPAKMLEAAMIDIRSRRSRAGSSESKAPVTSNTSYTLFVNSTDSFADTWEPFFHLLADYWPQDRPVVLNTETKAFTNPAFEIISTRVAREGERHISWGECVMRALDSIPTETFVYLQDDYFLYAPVRTDVVDEAVRVVESEDLDCLRLMECGGAGPYRPTPYPWLCEVSPRSHYFIALQAGIWTKTGMRRLLRTHESPWQMEIWGSRRAARLGARIWAVNRDVYSEEHEQVIPYEPTGIVRGQWKRDIVEALFAQHGIVTDYSQRGWLPDSGPTRSSLATKLRKLPAYAWARVRSL